MRCLNLIDSSNNAEEDLHLIKYSIDNKVWKKGQEFRWYVPFRYSTSNWHFQVPRPTLDYFLCFIGSRSHEETTNKRIRYILDNYCTVFESFCRYFHCLYCECLHLFTNPLVTASPWVNIFALRWIFGRGSSRPCCRRLQTSSWNNIRPRTWGCC